MRFSRQEYWSGLPFPSPGDLPNPEIEPGSPALQADSLPTEPPGKPSGINDSILFFFLIVFLQAEYSWDFEVGESLQVVCAYMLSLTLCNLIGYSPPGSSVHGTFQARNTGVGFHFLLQGIFPTQRQNPHLLGLLHWQSDSLLFAPPGKPSWGISNKRHTI